MAKWIHTDALDSALNSVKNNVKRLWLLSTYAQGDSFSTCNTNRIGASVLMDSSDFTGPSASGQNRVLTVTAQTGTATSTVAASAGNLHVAAVDTAADGGSDKVWAVTDETTEQGITSGNPISFPQWTITLNNLT